MMASKISCMQCDRHSECSHRTQCYVNYCGADQKKIDQYIKSAISECRSRRGRLIKQVIALHTSMTETLQGISAVAPA